MNDSDSSTPPNPSTSSSRSSRRSSRTRAKASKTRRKLIIWGVVALVVVGGLGWKLVVPRLKEARAQQFAAEAESLTRRQEYKEAGAKVLAALRFAPRDPVVLRTAANLCSEAGDPAGLGYYEGLIGTGQATTDDRVKYVRLALAVKRLDVAGRELQGLIRADPKNIELLHLLVQQQREAGDLRRATVTASYALSLQPDHPRSQFIYGILLNLNRTNSVQEAGRRALWSLALGDNEYADRAAEVLTTSAHLSPSELRLLIRDFQSRTNFRPTDLLRAYDLKMRLEPGRTNELVREAFDTISATNTSPVILALLCQWAAQNHQSEVILERVPAEVARTNTLLAPLRASALARAGRWNEVVPMLEDKRYPLDATVAHVLRAEMALSSGNRSGAETSYKAALEDTKLKTDHLWLLARSAESAGFPLVSAAAYQRLGSKDRRQAVTAAIEAARVLYQVEDLQVMRDALKKLSDQLPGDDTVAGELAWAELFLNIRPQDVKPVAERLARERPHDPQWRFLLALSRLRENRPSDALALIESESVNWEELRTRCQVVYVMALGANEQRQAARDYAAKVTGKLKTKEQELIRPYLPDR